MEEKAMLGAARIACLISGILIQRSRVNRSMAMAGIILGLVTISLFIWVLLTPWIMGVEPDVRSLQAFHAHAYVAFSSVHGGSLVFFPQSYP
jgi:hypothetical protein